MALRSFYFDHLGFFSKVHEEHGHVPLLQRGGIRWRIELETETGQCTAERLTTSAEAKAIEWHENEKEPCETCGARCPAGTMHRALQREEAPPGRGIGYVVGYPMLQGPTCLK